MRKMMLVFAVICSPAGLSVEKSAWSQEANDKPTRKFTDPAKPPKIYSRRVDFEFLNSSTPNGKRPFVSGKGELPLRLKITDEGTIRRVRRLQVLVTIFVASESSQAQLKADRELMVVTKVDPRIFKTPAGENGEFLFDLDIPLLPGNYVAHLFVCDPDQPYYANDVHLDASFPAPVKFPGSIKRATSFRVHVDKES